LHGAIAVGAADALDYPPARAEAGRRSVPWETLRRRCLRGGGYAGLAGARLKHAGAKVVLLEAQDRPGAAPGRERSLTGGWIDLGGQ
jgi:NADPH-dependent 2,4-dienoyl-CoA reductase/sulfur reductase-like enzyme